LVKGIVAKFRDSGVNQRKEMSRAKKIIQLGTQRDGETTFKKTKKKVDKVRSLNTQKLINKLDRLIRKVAKRGWSEGMDTRELNRRFSAAAKAEYSRIARKAAKKAAKKSPKLPPDPAAS
jgi:hypothetical protein